MGALSVNNKLWYDLPNKRILLCNIFYSNTVNLGESINKSKDSMCSWMDKCRFSSPFGSCFYILRLYLAICSFVEHIIYK